MGMVAQGVDFFCLFYPDSVVRNCHNGTLVHLLGTDDKRTAVSPIQDAVLYGVFHKRLKSKRWDQKILCCNLIDDLKLITEPLLFQVQVVCRMI